MSSRTTIDTYLSAYAVKPSYFEGDFVDQSKLTKKSWIKNPDGSDLKLNGYWHNSGSTSVTDNYFVVQGINGQHVMPEMVHQMLTSLCQTYFQEKYPDYSYGFVYFASDSSMGYEYPAISPTDEKNISAEPNVFEYEKILRYALASSIAYSIESGDFSILNNDYYASLMYNNSTNELDIVKAQQGENGLWALAIKVPAIPQKQLEEEIIIAYKGTSNPGDIKQDFWLTIQNFYEKNQNWQQESFNFCYDVIQNHVPNDSSIQMGYTELDGKNNIVLTGHSLGGYTAIQTATRWGLKARTFSAPATKIIDQLNKTFSNTMYFNNCINFVRKNDLVVSASGRHSENMVYFPSTGGLPLSNHRLGLFIDDILGPLAEGPGNDSNISPTNIYVTPTVTLGSGISDRINIWGKPTNH
ncbi:MAG: hypothetical protein F6K22_09435 [Okeania sp. SIO2F4]|uniref:lipase family protein n=1 Tax=Okeania sp. SIO2F4 TaxID=2607790 RepID=UPI00142A4653|nr:hypothetical protein [Okeania sp. SIO2F4]NES03054.1 hypothetical protein [Okeania sp. SIO2F4]